MNPLEALGQLTGLVRLNGTDEMPFDAQAAQLGHFRDRLLQLVFAEARLSETIAGLDLLSGLGLADCQKTHGVACSAVLGAGIDDAGLDLCKAIGQVSHATWSRWWFQRSRNALRSQFPLRGVYVASIGVR